MQFCSCFFFSPFSIAITSLGEERANLNAFRMFDRFVLVWICRFLLPLDFWEGLRFVIVALPGLFSYLFLVSELNVGLKSLLQQSLSKLKFYCDLVYKLRKRYLLAMTVKSFFDI